MAPDPPRTEVTPLRLFRQSRLPALDGTSGRRSVANRSKRRSNHPFLDHLAFVGGQRAAGQARTAEVGVNPGAWLRDIAQHLFGLQRTGECDAGELPVDPHDSALHAEVIALEEGRRTLQR